MIIGLVSSVVPAMTAVTPVQDLQTAQYGCWGRMNMKSKDRHRTQVVMQPVKFGDSAFSSLYKAHSESAIVRPSGEILTLGTHYEWREAPPIGDIGGGLSRYLMKPLSFSQR